MADVIVDTSALLAFFDGSEPDHAAVTDVIGSTTGLLVVSPYVVAELDYLVATRMGVAIELAVLDEMCGGAWHLADFDRGDLERARAVIDAYADRAIGVADASNVILADRHRTHAVVTLDHRHFDILRPLSGGRFAVLP